jgi:hypothetical protein
MNNISFNATGSISLFQSVGKLLAGAKVILLMLAP